jgi:pyridoxine 5-phosphate synthase
MTRLSVNINKIATIRNARGGNTPNVVEAAINCEKYGAEGITVHPRPDERHITYQDVIDLKKVVRNEFNVEGYPSKDFMELVLTTKPDQVTLVPDPPNVLTSNAGWDTITYQKELQEIVSTLKKAGIRTSIFIETDLKMIEAAVTTGVDRIELYTESYATGFESDREEAVKPFIAAGTLAQQLGLGLNAGHDLNQDNLRYFAQQVPGLMEVSIGHALISDALYVGLENAVALYKRALR